jgi:hypothetical protein
MGTFCITRKACLDRSFRLDELADFVEMLRHWYLIQAGASGYLGTIECDARIYAFARQRGGEIRNALEQALQDPMIDASDPDELAVRGVGRAANLSPDLAVWRAVIQSPAIADMCVLLRMTFAEPISRGDAGNEPGSSLCSLRSPRPLRKSLPRFKILLLIEEPWRG